MHANLLNGKVYIGQTNDPEKRWGKDGAKYIKKRDGKYMHPRFANAINKYGWENFEHIILAENLTEWQANFIETFMILCYRSWQPDNGYNGNIGGEVKSPSRETIEKMSRAKIGKKASDEARKNMSKARKDGKIKPHKRKPCSEETAQKISAANKGRKRNAEAIEASRRAQFKAVICEETQEIFESAKATDEHFGFKTGTVSHAITKGLRTHNLTFRYI